MKTIYVMIIAMGIFSAGYSQKVDEVKIQTSAVCGMCKKTIEDGLYTQKGIVSADLNVDNSIVTIKYKSSKIDPVAIKLFISSLGYDADEILADKTSYENLPGCCKKDSEMKH